MPTKRWEIPPKLWAILLSWGIGALALAALLSWWIASNEAEANRKAAQLQQEQAVKAAQVQVEQDRTMCVMLGLFTTGPEPVTGPAGDRGRAVLKAMRDYQATLRCDQIR